jgi:pyruvate dehydrogenase E2 component (dihydrolipoamide acetyltransferase)
LPAAGERSEVATAKGDVERIELSRVQQVIARRMAESKATVPDFALSVEVEMEAAVSLREELKRSSAEGGVVPSVNDLVVLACSRALREFPRANASYVDGRIESFGRVNVGVAVAGEDSLVVATVFDADQQTLGGIARQTRALAASVRDGSITPPALAGATFTVSNLGMFGVDHFTAVVNAPQAAILAVGALQQKPVVRGGEVVVRSCMTMTLSADHRILYGADAARFLGRVRELLEAPIALLTG